MTIDTDDLINSIVKSLDRIDHIDSEDIPNIDLYMDQVTTFMDKRLRNTTRNPQEDKILTKTMINNYAKNDLLPPPVKKKYSKNHMILLIFIYYFKGILSINDIQALLGPLTKRYFRADGKLNLQTIYDEVFTLEASHIDDLKESIQSDYVKSRELFQTADAEGKDFLQIFSFVSMLSYDVYVKKLLIEKIIDEYTKDSRAERTAAQEAKKKSAEAAKKAADGKTAGTAKPVKPVKKQ